MILNYDTPLFRPPAEANSLILQATYGCSWNKCTFCEMYTSKNFKIRREEEIIEEIAMLRAYKVRIKKIFIADGNAFIIKTDSLIRILGEINKTFSPIQRISSYCLPSDIKTKSLNDLIRMRELGLKLVYIGIESGNNELLKLMNKSETYESTRDAILKLNAAGINCSAMIINGLGGKQFTNGHAIDSARIINETQPKFLSTLVLSFPFGFDHFIGKYKNSFTPLDKDGLLKEMRLFLSETQLRNTIFRSDHVSNFLTLKGTLGKDKESLIKKIDSALYNPQLKYPGSEFNKNL